MEMVIEVELVGLSYSKLLSLCRLSQREGVGHDRLM